MSPAPNLHLAEFNWTNRTNIVDFFPQYVRLPGLAAAVAVVILEEVLSVIILSCAY